MTDEKRRRWNELAWIAAGAGLGASIADQAGYTVTWVAGIGAIIGVLVGHWGFLRVNGPN